MRMSRVVLCAALLLAPLLAAGGALAKARPVPHLPALPLPPLPPADQPFSTAAPVPDDNVQGPLAEVSSGPSVALRFYRAPLFDPGDGFTPGSRYQMPEDRKAVQTPGFSVSVPLK
jgi:hypothetical protein